jgi:hypothetical protein
MSTKKTGAGHRPAPAIVDPQNQAGSGFQPEPSISAVYDHYIVESNKRQRKQSSKATGSSYKLEPVKVRDQVIDLLPHLNNVVIIMTLLITESED